ncbi:ketoisovalerate oxidoreductase subunit VorA [Dissulfurispira thermophila]|uniref:Ketoisovalerate oxidoreductase subunit VorA n=2 Tax=root TaxID=1 RepID=A0A7G1H0F1_9BACT|nr:2-oxoacid:acceptor oxidoreductase family protein [Dissulfurispira thermophila]BCB96265.1 ketoisovalerate oxidoreductase subunit VorA [Dissulfurispira thermophila]
MENRIIIAGSGGQGILFLGKLLVYAGMIENKEVTWFPSYGAEMRGGTANCTVIVSDEMIGSPVIRNPDILIAMNEASYNRFSERLLSGGILIYDSSLINVKDRRRDVKIIGVPATEVSASFKNTKGANMIMMGALIGLTNILSIDSAIHAVDEITPARRKESVDTNKELIRKGYGLVKK